MATVNRYGLMQQLYGAQDYEKLASAKVLVVGAGGIGCEILKNLSLLGIKKIDLIDLDTIDVSNLNRQFLFRPEHVGHSKAEVAAQAAQVFNPDISVSAFHENVKNHKFNVSYISSFDVVLNALDNIDARRHVNRLCLAAGVPLFDSGTTGYLGQVTPIIKGFTSCYECYPKPTPKVYPICTIRSTPDKPVHCIVWAKECLKLIFGKSSESMLFEDESSTGEKSEYMHLLPFPENYLVGQSIVMTYVENLLIGLFSKEIQKRIDMEVYKTAKYTPVPLDHSIIRQAIYKVEEILSHKDGATPAPSSGKGWDQKVWNLESSLIEFILSFFNLIHSPTKDIQLLGQLSFDKDDLWAMKFVTAASNLRSSIFSIPLLSFHDAKGIAGNIIPAIATTNAIVAGVQVMQLIKFILNFNKADLFSSSLSEEGKQVIKEKLVKCFPQTYCLRFPTRKGFYLQPSSPDDPVETCYVCRKSQLSLQIDVNETTLDLLLAKVIKAKLGFNEPTISIAHDIIYEEGEDCDEDLKENLKLLLVNCPGGGIHDGTILTISDFTQDLETELVIHHLSNEEMSKNKNETVAADLFILAGAVPTAAVGSSSAAAAAEENNQGAADDDEVMIVDEIEIVAPQPQQKKRAREDDNQADEEEQHKFLKSK